MIRKRSKKTKNKTVEEIVQEYLEENGFDGLYNSNADCACKLDNLFVCDEVGMHCRAGYLQQLEGDDFLIGEVDPSTS